MNQLEIWGMLPADIQRRFASSKKSITFTRRSSVYVPGDEPRGLYYLESGLIGLVVAGKNGAEHMTRFYKASELFGHRSFLGREPYHGRATALRDSVVTLVPAEVVDWALDNSKIFQRHLIEKLARELKFAELHQFEVIENEVLERVAHALVYLKNVAPDYDWTRQEIANFCVSTVSTVIRAMAQLETMGLISQTGRHVKILTEEGLILLDSAHA